MSVSVLLIDSDVLIGFLAKKGISIYLAAHSVTNIFYLLRKVYSTSERKQCLLYLCNSTGIVEINAELINNVLKNDDFGDIEDCLQAECAHYINADYIVTRNIKDYAHSTIPAALPEDVLKTLMS